MQGRLSLHPLRRQLWSTTHAWESTLPTARGHATRAWRGRDQRMPVLNPGFVGQPSQEVNYDRQGDGPPSDRIGERPQPAQAAWARRFGPGRPTWPDIVRTMDT